MRKQLYWKLDLIRKQDWKPTGNTVQRAQFMRPIKKKKKTNYKKQVWTKPDTGANNNHEVKTRQIWARPGENSSVPPGWMNAKSRRLHNIQTGLAIFRNEKSCDVTRFRPRRSREKNDGILYGLDDVHLTHFTHSDIINMRICDKRRRWEGSFSWRERTDGRKSAGDGWKWVTLSVNRYVEFKPVCTC